MSENGIIEIQGSELLSRMKGPIQGNGSETEPYQVTKEDDFPINVRLVNSTDHVEFFELKFQRFVIVNSEHVSFMKCAFNNITLQRSEKVGMNDCQIVNLNLQAGKNSHFEGCSINWINNNSSSGNVFEQCKIGNPQALQIGFLQATGFHKPLLYLILFLLATMVPDIYFAVTLWHDFLSVIGLSVVIALLSAIYLLIRRSFRKAEKSPNIIK